MTQLNPDRMKLAEHVRRDWCATPEFETPPEALLDPGYWAHKAAHLTKGDIIHARPEDDSYFMELLVLEVGKLFAKVVALRVVKITDAQILNIKVPEGYEIKFRGPVKKWSVLRGTDVLAEGMLKAAAEKWVTDHVRAKEAA